MMNRPNILYIQSDQHNPYIMRILKQEQKLQIEWAKNTDPGDTLRWNLDPEKDSTRLDTNT